MLAQNATAVAPSIGILVMDARIERIPGMSATLPRSPSRCSAARWQARPSSASSASGTRSLLEPFIAAGWELVRQGVKALTTTCGFMILFQQDLAREFPVPVFTSSLLQLPFIERTLRPQDRIGILTADAGNLTPEHLRRAGGDVGRLTVCGLENEPFFREAIFSGSGRLEIENVEAEVVAQARRMTTADPAIRAVLLECSNLPPYAAAVQRAVGLPVYDFVTMLHHVRATLVRTPFTSPL